MRRGWTKSRSTEEHAAVYAEVGHRLSLASTAEEAAWVVADAADKLLGWDACYMHLLAPNLEQVVPVLNYDVIDGKRTRVPLARSDLKPAPMDRKVISEGAQLILRQGDSGEDKGLVPFGDTQRRSASLMFVGIRHQGQVVGTLSIQSYEREAYDEEALKILQSLADLCAGAMDRIRAWTALRQSEERFSKAFLMSPVALNISRLEDGTYLEVNDSLMRLLGYSREEIIGRTSLELGIWVDPADRPWIVNRVQREGSVREREIQVRRKDGELRTILASFERIQIGDEVCLLGISQDITDRLQLEAQLRQAQKMEAVGQLAAGIAHDFNNIMTIIQGYTTMVISSPAIAPETRHLLEQVGAAAERAAKLTHQLLTFSRKQMIQLRALDLSDVVKRVSTMLGRLLGEHILLRYELSPRLPLIQADAGMLEQLIMNLAVNARDAMPAGGRLDLRTTVEMIDSDYIKLNPEARRGQFVCLIVTDSGCGMDRTTLGRLFEPFFTTKEPGKGTGLGLATVYGIVKQHHGWIEVESAIGAGSVFRTFFPVCLESVPELPGPAPKAVFEKGPGGKETILLVEDERSLRQLARYILEEYGYCVLEAGSGVQALEIWAEQRARIDLLLTDVVMPAGMDGRELAERLRKERADLKVIYTSGYSLDVLGPDFVLEPGVVLLEKPYQPAGLAETVRSCLDGGGAPKG